GNPVGENVPVTFASPSALAGPGAGGRLANGTSSITVVTDANGQALASFDAHGVAGDYPVTATLRGVRAGFMLRNLARSAAAVDVNFNGGTGALALAANVAKAWTALTVTR